MRGYFPDAMVKGWEPLEGGFPLPDPDDRHVLAAAVRVGDVSISDPLMGGWI